MASLGEILVQMAQENQEVLARIATLEETNRDLLTLAQYNAKKDYEIEFFTYPFDGTRATLSAGTTTIDFAQGTVRSSSGAITKLSTDLGKKKKDFLRSITINANEDIIVQLDENNKIPVRANNWFTETYQQFTRVKITTTASADVFVLASTNPKAALEMVGESTSDDTPFADESITIADTTKTLTAATYDDATRAEMTLETAQIRFWDDGTAPTASVGIPIYVGDTIVLNSAAQIANFKAIRTGSTSGTLSIQYFH